MRTTEFEYGMILHMRTKTSIRFFNSKPVRARWNDEDSSWWYAATDIVSALIETKDARRYWNTFKLRHPELSSSCRQLKLTSSDGKSYATDCLNVQGLKLFSFSIPSKKRKGFLSWLDGMNDPIDEQSKRKAYELYENSILDGIEVGTVKGLQQIHAFLFEGLYDFAGKIRDKNISKEGFAFANCLYFDETFRHIESMPESNIDEIIQKYVEMNIAHPFMEGNGRSTRIWLDHLLKNRLSLCVDWQRIDKKDYLDAMKLSPIDPKPIAGLIKASLTDRITDREIFMKGIDYSYYYEEVEE